MRSHWDNDGRYGIDSNFVILFGVAGTAGRESLVFRNYRRHDAKTANGNVFAKTIANHKPDVCVFHGAWLMGYFADLDACRRRALMLHGDYVDHYENSSRGLTASARSARRSMKRFCGALPELPVANGRTFWIVPFFRRNRRHPSASGRSSCRDRLLRASGRRRQTRRSRSRRSSMR